MVDKIDAVDPPLVHGDKVDGINNFVVFSTRAAVLRGCQAFAHSHEPPVCAVHAGAAAPDRAGAQRRCSSLNVKPSDSVLNDAANKRRLRPGAIDFYTSLA